MVKLLFAVEAVLRRAGNAVMHHAHHQERQWNDTRVAQVTRRLEMVEWQGRSGRTRHVRRRSVYTVVVQHTTLVEPLIDSLHRCPLRHAPRRLLVACPNLHYLSTTRHLTHDSDKRNEGVVCMNYMCKITMANDSPAGNGPPGRAASPAMLSLIIMSPCPKNFFQ